MIATQGSVNSHFWENKLRELKPQMTLYSKACPLLVPLAEKKLYNSFISKLILKKYLKELKQYQIDSLIFGCTHYPLFQEIISNELGSNVNLINIGTASAKKTYDFLLANQLQANVNNLNNINYFVSSSEKSFLKKVKKII